MRHPSMPPGNNGNSMHTRGTIRTHLGRKRTGAGPRTLKASTLEGVQQLAESARHRQEELFDRLLGVFQRHYDPAGEMTAAAFEGALDAACAAMVSAGELTAEAAARLRQYVRRDLLHRDHPTMSFRTGDITTAGTLTCAGCGWCVRTIRSTVLPPCPQCAETAFHKSG